MNTKYDGILLSLIITIISVLIFFSLANSVHADSVIATIPVGTNPVDVAFNPNNRDMYVVNQVGGGNTCTVSVIDSITNQVIATIPVGIRSSDIAFNPSKYEGKLEYSIGKYERLIRATIPIKLSSSKEEVESKSCYLLLSFDLNSNVMDVIENKIMPFIGKNIEQKL